MTKSTSLPDNQITGGKIMTGDVSAAKNYLNKDKIGYLRENFGGINQAVLKDAYSTDYCDNRGYYGQ